MSDNDDFLAFARRIMRALARRVGDADPDDLAEMMRLRGVLDDAMTTAVAGMRANGFSWAEIGAAVGMTRQSAWEKWRQAVPDAETTEKETQQ